MVTWEKNETNGGCFAWCISLKKAVNERWARARNSLRKRFHGENKPDTPLGPDDLLNETGCPDMVLSKIPVSPPKERRSPVTMLVSQVDRIGESDKRKAIDYDANGEPETDQVRTLVPDLANEACRIAEQGTQSNAERNPAQIRKDGPEHVIVTDSESLSSSVVSDMATAAVNSSLTNIVNEIKDETKLVTMNDAHSLSPGQLSDIATAVVNESLTNIVHDMKDKTTIINKDDTSSMSSGQLSEFADAVVTASLSGIVSEGHGVTQIDGVTGSRSTPIPRTVTEMLENCNIDPKIGLSKGEQDGLPPCSP